MFFLLRFAVYFSMSFAILCIPIQGKSLFGHLHGRLAPVGREIINDLKVGANRGLNKGKRFTKRLFDSAPPVMDSVRSMASGTELAPQHEDYTQEEERLLRNVMNDEDGGESE